MFHSTVNSALSRNILRLYTQSPVIYGAAAVNVEVKQKKPEVSVFAGVVAPGGRFSFSGADDKGTLSTEIYIMVMVTGQANRPV